MSCQHIRQELPSRLRLPCADRECADSVPGRYLEIPEKYDEFYDQRSFERLCVVARPGPYWIWVER